jgi:hypothetical protein
MQFADSLYQHETRSIRQKIKYDFKQRHSTIFLLQ